MDCDDVFDVLVNDGSIGINLKGKDNGLGAYIESFYRTPHGYMLPAEKSQQLLIGDIIHSINDEIVRQVNLTQIHDLITHSSRPLKLSFVRPKYNLESSNPVAGIIRDPKKLPFVDQYLLQNCTRADAAFIASKIMLFNHIDLILENVEYAELSTEDWTLVAATCFTSEVWESIRIDGTLPFRPDAANTCESLRELRLWLETDLLSSFVSL